MPLTLQLAVVLLIVSVGSYGTKLSAKTNWQEIKVGLTKELKIRCELGDDPVESVQDVIVRRHVDERHDGVNQAHLRHIVSITLYKGTSNSHQSEKIASITPFHPARAESELEERIQVSGGVNNDHTEGNHDDNTESNHDNDHIDGNHDNDHAEGNHGNDHTSTDGNHGNNHVDGNHDNHIDGNHGNDHNDGNHGSGFLEVTWKTPDHDQEGVYTCEVGGLDDANDFVELSDAVSVESSPASEVDLLKNHMETNLAEINAKLAAIANSVKAGDENLGDQLRTEMSKLKAKLAAVENRHSEVGEVKCGSHYGGNKNVQVTFKRPYTHPPIVMAALAHVDVGADKNARIVAAAHSISTTGFKLQCHQWDDTRLYGATARWISVGA